MVGADGSLAIYLNLEAVPSSRRTHPGLDRVGIGLLAFRRKEDPVYCETDARTACCRVLVFALSLLLVGRKSEDKGSSEGSSARWTLALHVPSTTAMSYLRFEYSEYLQSE